MHDLILGYEPVIRLSFFLGVLLVMALWEWRAPRRALTVSKVWRWTSNLGIVVLNSLLLRLIFPATAVGGGGGGAGPLLLTERPSPWPSPVKRGEGK